MTVTLYGIRNCDTIKKAKKWLEANDIKYNFHDFRVDGTDKKLLDNFSKQIDWQVLLNTRGSTWRKLSENQREGINKSKAMKVMLEYPAIIKRPVLSYKKKFYVGFKDQEYKEIFS